MQFMSVGMGPFEVIWQGMLDWGVGPFIGPHAPPLLGPFMAPPKLLSQGADEPCLENWFILLGHFCEGQTRTSEGCVDEGSDTSFYATCNVNT